MKRIVILGEKYSHNLGDGVICQCVEAFIRQNAAEKEIISLDLSCRKDYDDIYHFPLSGIQRIKNAVNSRFFALGPVKKFIRKKMGEQLYTYWKWYRQQSETVKRLCQTHQADLVVFAGGELFKDYFLFYIRDFVRHYTKQGAKIWFNACGCDSKNIPYVSQHFQKILNNAGVKRVTTRSSAESCCNLIAPSQYMFIPDPVICAASVFERSEQEHMVGLGIMCLDGISDDREKLLAFWSDVVTQLKEQNIPFKLFCNGADEDFLFAQQLVAYLGLPQDYLLPPPHTPQELVSQITRFERICSFRMHSLIIAYSFGIPFVGLGWDQKLYDFAEYVNLPGQICDWRMEEAKDILKKMFSCQRDEERFVQLQNMIRNEFKSQLE